MDEPVGSGELVGSGEPVWSVWLVCSVWPVGALWACCAVVPGWLAGASVPPLVALPLDPAAVVVGFGDPLFGLAAAAPELAVREAFERVLKVAARARRRLDLCQLLERTAIMRAALALPPRCWLTRLLISESICDPAPIGPGG